MLYRVGPVALLLNAGADTTGVVGVSLTFAFGISGSLGHAMRLGGELEKDLVAIERLVEYSNKAKEADGRKTIPTDDDWLKKGRVAFEDYHCRYRENTPLVLKGLDFTIEGGQKKLHALKVTPTDNAFSLLPRILC